MSGGCSNGELCLHRVIKRELPFMKLRSDKEEGGQEQPEGKVELRTAQEGFVLFVCLFLVEKKEHISILNEKSQERGRAQRQEKKIFDRERSLRINKEENGT